MARIVITNPTPLKRVFHNNARMTARVCRWCGAPAYGRNAGICLGCLTKMRKAAHNGK